MTHHAPHRRVGVLLVPLLTLLSTLSPQRDACALDLLPDFFGNDEGVVMWEGGDQYIRFVPQDALPGGGAPPPNEHPARFASADLTIALESLTLYRKGGLLSRDENAALFTRGQAQLLGRKLSEALARAEPGQDVTFAVVGAYDNALLGKDRLSVAGRVFVTGGRLHLILGDVLRPTRDSITAVEGAFGDTDNSIDRNANPHRPGQRRKARDLSYNVAAVQGVSYFEGSDGAREDWVVLDIAALVAEAERKATPNAAAAPAADDTAVRAEAARLALERRQLREEMARMRKEMREGQGLDARTAEERLATLDALREKQLITDEEYAQKRSEILEGI